MGNALYYGDNLSVLRESIASESVDLIYLDPPFNSNASYNVLFKAPSGERSAAQIEAFEDTWHWNESAELAFDDVMRGSSSQAAMMLRAMLGALGRNDMMAYLAMMAVRLLELHRVLKPTGSLYLHCDPTASHYLKVILDSIFDPAGYKNEISWRRSGAHNDTKQGRKQCGNVRDILLFYTKSGNWTWNPICTPYDPTYVTTMYRFIETGTGRAYRKDNLTAAKTGGDTRYEWRIKRPRGGEWQADLVQEYRQPLDDHEYRGVLPYGKRIWAYSRENMVRFAAEDRIAYSKSGMPNYKRFLDEMPGVALQNDWEDIRPASGAEFLGYPTQKPVALLQRIVAASSAPGDLVLDPFCGCGTAIHAAEKLGRRWIGIDITHLAISLIERRLADAFPSMSYDVFGVPRDLGGAIDLAARDKHEFQKWFTAVVGAQPYRGGKKGMDRGIDGYLHFRDADRKPQFAVVSVKGGAVSPTHIRDLRGTMEREGASLGLFLSLEEPTREMQREATAAGSYETGGQRVPRVQILTAQDVFDGTRPRVPFGHTEGFKQSPREKPPPQDDLF